MLYTLRRPRLAENSGKLQIDDATRSTLSIAEVGRWQISDERSGRGEILSALHRATGLIIGKHIKERVD